MAKSRVNKDRQEKLKQFKNKQKKMSEQTNIPQMPPVRSIPVWSPDAQIVISGREWEAIQNGLGAVQTAQQAAQAVLSQNIIEGIIQMDFEKLDPKTLEYIPMTDEEKHPHIEEFNKAVELIKAQREGNAPQPVNETESIPVEETKEETTEVEESK